MSKAISLKKREYQFNLRGVKVCAIIDNTKQIFFAIINNQRHILNSSQYLRARKEAGLTPQMPWTL